MPIESIVWHARHPRDTNSRSPEAASPFLRPGRGGLNVSDRAVRYAAIASTSSSANAKSGMRAWVCTFVGDANQVRNHAGSRVPLMCVNAGAGALRPSDRIE